MNIKSKLKSFIKKALGIEQYTPRPYIVKEKNAQALKGKCGIITGATGAIGSATALKFAAEGATVGVGGRSIEKIDEVIDFIKKIIPDANLIPILIDVTDNSMIESSITSFF